MPAVSMGRCKKCEVSWCWKSSTKITLRGEQRRRITCPLCGTFLWQTTSWAKTDWRSMDGSGHPKGFEIPTQSVVVPRHTHPAILKRRQKTGL